MLSAGAGYLCLTGELFKHILGGGLGGLPEEPRVQSSDFADGSLAGEKDKILSDLDQYCALDTLAMVEIYNFLADLVGSAGPKAQPQQLALDW